MYSKDSTTRRHAWAIIDDPEIPTSKVISRLTIHSQAVDRLRKLIEDYFKATGQEAALNEIKLETRWVATRQFSIDLADLVLAHFIEHEHQWLKDVRRARRFVLKEVKYLQRLELQELEAKRRRKKKGW